MENLKIYFSLTGSAYLLNGKETEKKTTKTSVNLGQWMPSRPLFLKLEKKEIFCYFLAISYMKHIYFNVSECMNISCLGERIFTYFN